MAVSLDAPSGSQAVAVGDEPRTILTIRHLMWRRFRRNRLAMLGGIFLICMYLSALFAGFLAPYGVRTTHDRHAGAPPNGLRFLDADGHFHLRPFVYGLETGVNPQTFQKEYRPIVEEIYPLQFFHKGVPYTLFGFLESDIHLFGVEEPGKIFLFGTDRQGRDLFSRVLYGAQISLTVGLVGVFLTLIIGTLAGIASGLFGGIVDSTIQRIIEVLLSFPLIPLWLALAVIVPPNWSSIRIFFAISILLALVNWGPLARQVRGMVLALREEDFVIAARYANSSNWRIITRHLLPNTLSHVLVIATLAIPQMILGETALSFLGLGIKPPLTSWGVLLSEAQQIRVLFQQEWLLIPAIFVILTIISFNFLGDGIRDAADPFSN